MGFRDTKLKIHFYLVFVGVNLTFFPQFILGLLGMPRRYVDYPDRLEFWNVLSRIGSYISLVSVIFYIWVLYSEISQCRVVVRRLRSVRGLE